MRPPWAPRSRDEAELEALQTDVMRFLAILGLCLAAIFSLVQGAAQEQVIGQVDPVPAPAESAAAETQQLVTTAPPGRPATEQGFTLEFASVESLETLLRNERITLYANQGNQFWSVDSSGQVEIVDAPGSYYQMQAETVPGHLLDRIGGIIPGAATIWGVSLPPEAVSKIEQLTGSRTGGSLLIGADATVTLAGD